MYTENNWHRTDTNFDSGLDLKKAMHKWKSRAEYWME
jgi:hypothetical protein